MGEPFLGEVKLISFSYAPKNWAYCDGQDMPISQNAALYSLLQTQFGGNGQTIFNLPDLRGRTPVHTDTGLYEQGAIAGLETVTLDVTEMGAHYHELTATTTDGSGYRPTPTQTMTFASATDIQTGGTPYDVYGLAQHLTELNPGTCTAAGGGLAHANLQPSIVVGFIIALAGAYPSRN